MAAIRRKASGKWELDFYLGSRRKRISFSCKSEAERYLRELLLRPLDLSLGYKPLAIVSISEAIGRYKRDVWPLKQEATVILETRYFGELVKRYIDLSVDQITSQDMGRLQSELRRTLKEATVNRHFNLFRHFFKKCCEWDYTRINPTVGVKNLLVKARPPKVLNAEDVGNLLQTCGPALMGPVLLMVRAGLRRKEVSSLRWASIDFSGKKFCVEPSDGFIPKGGKSRTIPMTEELHSFFARHREQSFRMGMAGSSSHVFLNSERRPWSPDRLTKEVGRVGRRIGISSLSPHRLRHTFCTDLVRGNQNLERVRMLAGHSSLRTTERYLHLVPEELREGMEVVQRLQSGD
jgi:integrase/recombinase XerC